LKPWLLAMRRAADLPVVDQALGRRCWLAWLWRCFLGAESVMVARRFGRFTLSPALGHLADRNE
jgi:hypothetical protein